MQPVIGPRGIIIVPTPMRGIPSRVIPRPSGPTWPEGPARLTKTKRRI